jgi:membrane protein implicated in regulation of membrane protease activity
MEADLAWAILGLALVIIELLTGTFYLLMLGLAAFGAALAAWIGQPFGVQAVVAAVVAAAGCYGVHVYRAKNDKAQMPSIDAGQPASFESWVDEGARLARVRYRGAPWDARIELEAGAAPASSLTAGAMLYVTSIHGNTLQVSTRRPG